MTARAFARVLGAAATLGLIGACSQEPSTGNPAELTALTDRVAILRAALRFVHPSHPRTAR